MKKILHNIGHLTSSITSSPGNIDEPFRFGLKRNLMHIFCGLSVIAIGIFFPTTHLKILSIILLFGIAFSFISKRWHIPIITGLLDIFERKGRKKLLRGQGALLFLVSSILSFLIFEHSVALASISILTFGDSVSYIVGRSIGKTKTPLSQYKFLEGSIAGFIAASIAASVFVLAHQAIVASAVAMTLEMWERSSLIDDNLTIPMVAGMAITIM